MDGALHQSLPSPRGKEAAWMGPCASPCLHQFQRGRKQQWCPTTTSVPAGVPGRFPSVCEVGSKASIRRHRHAPYAALGTPPRPG
eukprot:119709-Chlamydomonas_euryale.AAC.1